MNDNFIHILSEIPCSININGYYCGNIDNKNNFEIDFLSKCSNIFISYFPISDDTTYNPFSFSLHNSNKYLQSNNTNIDIIPFPNNNYDIYIKPLQFNQIIDSKILINQNLGKYFISIVTNNITKITLFSGSSIIYEKNIPKSINCNIEEFKNYFIIRAIIKENLYYLLIINTNDLTTIFSDYSHSIENTDGVIQSLKKLHNIPHHAEVNKFDLNNTNFEKYYVYEYDRAIYTNNTLLIPKAFLQCIQVNDEEYIKTLLSKNLVNTPIDKFKKYFDGIDRIYLNRHENKQNKINYTTKGKTYKNYNFIIEDNKIVEIEEIF